jgi:lipopolysaccharide export system permease protein
MEIVTGKTLTGASKLLKTLHVYLTKQVLVSLLMTVTVFTFVLLLGNVLKEILGLLIAGQVEFRMVIKAIALLIPYVMAYVLPFATITAIILTFGRFSADQELTAVRASGISLISLVTPIVLLSIILCALCGWFNMWVAPQCRKAYKNITFSLGARSVSNLITEDRFIDELPGYVMYIRKKRGDELEDVRVYEIEKSQIMKRILAKRGTMFYDDSARTISFKLIDVVTEIRRDPSDLKEDENLIGPRLPEKPLEWLAAEGGVYEVNPIDLSAIMKNERKPKLFEMNCFQLQEERRDLEAKGINSMPVVVQIHRQVSFSFACFAFTLVGIPLAIQAHRRETSVGVAISLMIVVAYYSFLILGESLGTREHLNAQYIIWIPNFLFPLLGGLLLVRANRR